MQVTLNLDWLERIIRLGIGTVAAVDEFWFSSAPSIERMLGLFVLLGIPEAIRLLKPDGGAKT